ncbi:WSC domain-containing 2 [Cordyceps militaris]|uniref:WSC domain-containing 2 n=1 Tax=Cordyceps militaris TaxID=73501 RepID=A0A2H4S7V6_CORMI|nr:WSC domain-containing 2 [Cordyceps militaris]
MPAIARLLIVFCAILAAVFLYPHAEGICIDGWQERKYRISRQENARERVIHRQVGFVVGFYIGPSYSAAVALFRNGTTLNLAKVDGDVKFRAAMERRIARSYAVQDSYFSGEDLSEKGGHFGSSTTEELEQVFIPAIQTLKERSETILQLPIEHVHFATPWIAEYDQIFKDLRDTFLVAGRRVGLKRPFVYDTWNQALMPLHLNEANAVLAAAGRNFCEECFCVDRPHRESSGRGSVVFYIKTSLFISEQPASCVFDAFWVKLELDTAYGYEQLEAKEPTQYWEDVKARAMAFIKPLYEMRQRRATIILAGEATTNPDFLSVAVSIQQDLQALRGNTSYAFDDEHQRVVALGPVELIVADDGVFDAAKGAALMMRTDFWGYCDDTEEQVMRLACHDHFVRSGVEPGFSDNYLLEGEAAMIEV